MLSVQPATVSRETLGHTAHLARTIAGSGTTSATVSLFSSSYSFLEPKVFTSLSAVSPSQPDSGLVDKGTPDPANGTGRYSRNCLTDCQVKHVIVTSTEVVQCLRGLAPYGSGSSLIFAVGQNEVLDLTLELDNTSGTLTSHSQRVCWLDFAVPSGYHRSILIMKQTCSEDVSLVMRAYSVYKNNPINLTWGSCQQQTAPPPGASVPNMVRYHANHSALGLKVGSLSGRYEARILVQAMVQQTSLQMRFIDSQYGYIESNHFDVAHNFVYTPNFSSSSFYIDADFALVYKDLEVEDWIAVRVPDGHVIMLSAVAVSLGLYGKDLNYRYFSDYLLEVLVQDPDSAYRKLLWRLDGPKQLRPAPWVSRRAGLTLWVHYRNIVVRTTDSRTLRSAWNARFVQFPLFQGLGFRLLISFHPAPQKVSRTQWDCSGPNWSNFSHHLTCNLVKECLDGRDEAECPYTLCADHSLLYSGLCYTLRRSLSSLSWHEAHVLCRQDGGTLATLQAPGSLQYLTDHMHLNWLTRAGHIVIVGVRLAPDLALLLYRYYLQLVDGTVAYNLTVNGGLWEVDAIFSYGVLQQNSESLYLPLDSAVASTRTTHAISMEGELHRNIRQVCESDSCYFLCQAPSTSLRARTGPDPMGSTALSSSAAADAAGSSSKARSTLEADYDLQVQPLEGLASPGQLNGKETTSAGTTSVYGPAAVHIAAVEEAVAPASTRFPRLPLVVCPQGHVVLAAVALEFSACFQDGGNDVITVPVCVGSLSCDTVTSSMMAFSCDSGLERVPYSVVCDHRRDCRDGSDEAFCSFPVCNFPTHFECYDKECLPVAKMYDNNADCLTGEDLAGKHAGRMAGYLDSGSRLPPGHLVIRRLAQYEGDEEESRPLPENATRCPDGLYRCGDKGLCLPVHTRCNDVYDCPAKEDEEGCATYLCPGFYRCRRSPVCLDPAQLCDGRAQCPLHDDEWMCRLACPTGCRCLGWDFNCPKSFPAAEQSQLRALNATASGMRLRDLQHNVLLLYLVLSACRLQEMDRVSLGNLLHLDLSDNLLRVVSVDDLMGFSNIRTLILSRNPIDSLFDPGSTSYTKVFTLCRLIMSEVRLQQVDLLSFQAFPNLRDLNMSGCGVDMIISPDDSILSSLEKLDVRGCPLTIFPYDWLQKASGLNYVYGENFKLCCRALLPEHLPESNCFAPFNEVSSCDSLLRSSVYLAALVAFCILSILGNAGSLIYRVLPRHSGGSGRSGFSVFVVNLCLSDSLMGFFLLIIGAADRWFHNSYVWQDSVWRHSAPCSLAGVLALASCEVSALFIFLITADRFLVLRFPFSQLRFRWLSAWLAAGACWLVGLGLAAAPLLLPAARRWWFYSQTGLCVPLPVAITVGGAGRHYVFAVMVVLNFLLFLLIAAGQASIFATVRGHHHFVGLVGDVSGNVGKSRRLRDQTIARRLLTVAVADFLCWFPVGLLGILSSLGAPVPGEVSVSVVIFVLPLNASLNPFLYTLNVYRERLQQRQENKLLAHLKETQLRAVPL